MIVPLIDPRPLGYAFYRPATGQARLPDGRWVDFSADAVTPCRRPAAPGPMLESLQYADLRPADGRDILLLFEMGDDAKPARLIDAVPLFEPAGRFPGQIPIR